MWAFIAILPCMWLAVVSACFLGNVRITMKKTTDEQGRATFGKENVIEGSFLSAVWKRLLKRGENGQGDDGMGGVNHGEKNPVAAAEVQQV